jgi:hypothetical protein
MGADADDTVAVDGAGEKIDSELDRVGLHENQRFWATATGEFIGVRREHRVVRAGERKAVGGCSGVGRYRRSREHHDDLSIEVSGFVPDLDTRSMIGKSIAKIGTQPVQFVFARPAAMSDQLEATIGVQHPPLEQSDGELATTGTCCADDGNARLAHWAVKIFMSTNSDANG